MDKYDIVVGIPTLNEADSISFVLSQVDKGLKEYFPQKKSLIVNFDSGSNDGTREVFMATPSDNDKITQIAQFRKGKGENVLGIIDIVNKVEASAGITVDGDLKSILPEWVKKLLSPILIHNDDFVCPLYTRNRYEGSTTNHLCVPVLRSLFNIDLRQPIGGEFGFSRKFVQLVKSAEIPDEAHKYGIDIFLTTIAIVNNLPIRQVDLGKKFHKPSFGKMVPMFGEVATTLITLGRKYGRISYSGNNINEGSDQSGIDSEYRKPSFEDISKRRLQAIEMFNQIDGLVWGNANLANIAKQVTVNQYYITKMLWENTLKAVLEETIFGTCKIDILVKCLVPIFLLRVLTFYDEIENKSPQEVYDCLRYNVALNVGDYSQDNTRVSSG